VKIGGVTPCITEMIPKMHSVQVLFISKSEELKKSVNGILQEQFGGSLALERVDNLQEAIEGIEQKQFTPELVLIDQKTASPSFLKLLFELIPLTAIVVICADGAILADLSALQTHARFILASTIDTELSLVLKKLETIGKIQSVATDIDQEYVTLEADRILRMKPLPIDIYLKVHAGKYVKLFRRGDEILSSDLAKYSGQSFYLSRVDCEQMLKEQASRIDAIAADDPIDQASAKKVADMSQDLVKTLVTQVGFTEEAQQIAKSSVNMSLKLIGSKPRLSSILTELKKKEGNFVTSHSFLLGQLACAMAYTVGWRSASTYFKLSMAAFLHDIALNLTTLEQEVTYEEALASGMYSPDELKILRFHPTKASEYTRQFSEIPVDVEQIVAQHHERPNGSGYPRGLTSKYISPLSAIFILSHELILFMMKFPDAKVEKFYEIAESEFTQNPFRKLISELKSSAKNAENPQQ
jgi:hypothetical protein